MIGNAAREAGYLRDEDLGACERFCGGHGICMDQYLAQDVAVVNVLGAKRQRMNGNS